MSWEKFTGVQNQKKYCPLCGTEMENGACFCGKCGYKVKEYSVKGKKKDYKVTVGIFFFISVIVVGMAVKTGMFGFLNKIGENSKIPNLYYVKDDTAYGVNLSNLESIPKEFGTDENIGGVFSRAVDLRMYGEDGVIFNNFKPELMSTDGKYHFFIEDVKEDECTYSLYCSKEGGEPVKVDSDIEVHELAEDNRIVYMKNGNLYFSDLKSTSRIGQNITTFYLNKEKNKVLWGEYNAEDHNKYYDYYIRDLGQKSQKYKIAEKCTVRDWRTDFSKILMAGESGYFTVENQNKIKKIHSKGACIWSDLEKEQLIFADYTYGNDRTEFTIWEKGEEDSFTVKTGKNSMVSDFFYDEKEEKIYASSQERGLISINGAKKHRGGVKEINIHAGMVWNKKLIQNEEGRETKLYYIVNGGNGEADQLFCNEKLLYSGEDMVLDLTERTEGPVWGIQEESLFKLKGTEIEIIADKVNFTFFQVLGGEKAVFLENYDKEKQCGDLMYYDGEKLHLVDTDVREFLFWDTGR